MTSRVGQQLGNYRLTQLVGNGGFAEVYLGEHVHLGTRAAIKVLHAQLGEASAIEGFRKEARIIAQLVHPNIIHVLDFGVEQTVPYLVMEHAPYGSLRQIYRKGQQVPLNSIVEHTKQIAAALQHAHNSKIIHRDIKPANMLIGNNNQILVSDFGIAVISQSTHNQTAQDMAGTISYMAPEQIQSHARPASDQYSLAIMVYEGLCGQRPFDGTFTEVAVKHMTIQPPPLHTMVSISPAVEYVVSRALAKDSAQRFPQVSDFAQALEQAANMATASFYENAVTVRSYPSDLTPTLPAQYASPSTPQQNLTYLHPTEVASQPVTNSAQQAMNQATQNAAPNTTAPNLTPLMAPFSQSVKTDPQTSVTRAQFTIPSYILVGVYVIIMAGSMLSIFSTNNFDAMQKFISSNQAIPAPFDYLIWLNLILPIEALLASAILGTRRGFFAVAIIFTLYTVLEYAYFHSLIHPLLFVGFLLVPLIVGQLYNSRQTDGCLRVGVLFLLGALLMLASYRLVNHAFYGHSMVSSLRLTADIFLYVVGASTLALITTLLERLIRFFVESIVNSRNKKNIGI